MEKIYPYAVARIRAIESTLFTNTELEQILNESPERIMAILQEHKYDTDEIERVEDYEIVLKKEIEKLYKLISEIVPEEDFKDIFLCKNDFHNMKVLIKSEIMNKENNKILIDGGTIDVEVLKTAIAEKKYDILPDIMSKAVLKVKEKYETTQMSHIIDLTLDKYTYLYMSQLAKKSKIEFIIEYVKKMCDIVNIRTFFRVKAISKNFEDFEDAFIENGDISIRVFQEAFDSEEPIAELKQMSNFQMLEKVEDDIISLAKICDNYLTEYVSVAKYEALGVEPLIAYIYAKETEIKNIRIILTGKLNNVDVNVIKERLRDSYV